MFMGIVWNNTGVYSTYTAYYYTLCIHFSNLQYKVEDDKTGVSISDRPSYYVDTIFIFVIVQAYRNLEETDWQWDEAGIWPDHRSCCRQCWQTSGLGKQNMQWKQTLCHVLYVLAWHREILQPCHFVHPSNMQSQFFRMFPQWRVETPFMSGTQFNILMQSRGQLLDLAAAHSFF